MSVSEVIYELTSKLISLFFSWQDKLSVYSKFTRFQVEILAFSNKFRGVASATNTLKTAFIESMEVNMGGL